MSQMMMVWLIFQRMNKKVNLINSDIIKEGEILDKSLDLDDEIDNIGLHNCLMDLYSNFNDYNIPLIDRLLIKENVKEDLKKTILDYKYNKSKKRQKVTGDSEDELIIKKTFEKIEKKEKKKFRYPKSMKKK